MVRTLVAACAVAALVATATVAFSRSTDTDQVREDSKPLLIHYAQTFPSTHRIAAHREWYRSLPFDGMVVGGRRVDPLAFMDPENSYSERAVLADVRQLPADMGAVRHNFFGLRMVSPLDWSDDAAWQTIERNLRNLARALRVSGKPWAGVFLDNEWYGDTTSPWDYGSGSQTWTYSETEGATPGLEPAEARALVRARGEQVMDALMEGWPGIVVFHSQGPWISQPATSAMLERSGVEDNDVSFANELSGSFTIGMMEATWGTSAELVDGGRFYGLRTAEQFRAARAWMESGSPNHATADLDEQDAARYEANASPSFGVYDKDKEKEGWPPMPPEELALLTRLALQETDRYVWLYTEEYEWGRGPTWKEPVPDDYLVATSVARTTAHLLRQGSSPWAGP